MPRVNPRNPSQGTGGSGTPAPEPTQQPTPTPVQTQAQPTQQPTQQPVQAQTLDSSVIADRQSYYSNTSIGIPRHDYSPVAQTPYVPTRTETNGHTQTTSPVPQASSHPKEVSHPVSESGVVNYRRNVKLNRMVKIDDGVYERPIDGKTTMTPEPEYRQQGFMLDTNQPQPSTQKLTHNRNTQPEPNQDGNVPSQKFQPRVTKAHGKVQYKPEPIVRFSSPQTTGEREMLGFTIDGIQQKQKQPYWGYVASPLDRSQMTDTQKAQYKADTSHWKEWKDKKLHARKHGETKVQEGMIWDERSGFGAWNKFQGDKHVETWNSRGYWEHPRQQDSITGQSFWDKWRSRNDPDVKKRKEDFKKWRNILRSMSSGEGSL